MTIRESLPHGTLDTAQRQMTSITYQSLQRRFLPLLAMSSCRSGEGCIATGYEWLDCHHTGGEPVNASCAMTLVLAFLAKKTRRPTMALEAQLALCMPRSGLRRSYALMSLFDQRRRSPSTPSQQDTRPCGSYRLRSNRTHELTTCVSRCQSCIDCWRTNKRIVKQKLIQTRVKHVP